MITSIWQVGEPGAENEAELKKYCAKSRDMVEEAVRVFERVSLNHAWYNRLLENRQVIAEQLDAMAYIMQDCAREERVLDTQERRAISEIRYRAKERGISIEEIHLCDCGGTCIRQADAGGSRHENLYLKGTGQLCFL